MFCYEVVAKDARTALKAANEVMAKEVRGIRDIGDGQLVALGGPWEVKPGEADHVSLHMGDAWKLVADSDDLIPTREALDASPWRGATLPDTPDRGRYTPFAVAIDCGTELWEVRSYEKVPRTKATAKFHLRYVVVADIEGDEVVIGDYDKVTDAKEMAAHVMADPDEFGLAEAPGEVRVSRRPVSDGGSDVAAAYRMRRRTAKRRPAKVPAGATVTALRHWVVYGRA